jgi:hypothetical protein
MAKKRIIPSKVLSEALAEIGRRGGKKRAKKLTPEQRRVIAKKAADARWARRST